MSLLVIGLITSATLLAFDAAGTALFPTHNHGAMLLRSLWFLLGWNFVLSLTFHVGTNTYSPWCARI